VPQIDCGQNLSFLCFRPHRAGGGILFFSTFTNDILTYLYAIKKVRKSTYGKMGEKTVINNKIQKNVWLFTFNGNDHLVDDRELVMNELGQIGWELAGVLPFNTTLGYGAGAGTYTNAYTLFFKRSIA
jgi:hypothetical protein